MATYFMDEGAFELTIPGLRDITTHTLVAEVEGGPVALLVLRSRLPEGIELEHAVGRHRREQSLRFLGFEELGERERLVGGAPALEVRSRYREDTAIVYRREAHVLSPRRVWLVLAMRAAFALQADCDAWMDELLDSFGFRPDD